MKIFLIDRYNKNYDIVKGLQTHGIENIETKENTKIKATKNDVLILLEDSDFEALSKTTKVIWITKNNNEKDIWKFVNLYNCIDIIDANLDREYIIKRIAQNIA